MDFREAVLVRRPHARGGEPDNAEPACPPPAATDTDPVPLAPRDPHAQIAATVVTQLLRRTRYLLTLKGRPPLRLVGIETYAELQEVLAHRDDPQLPRLVRGLEDAVASVAPMVAEVQIDATWMARITTILSAASEPASMATQVAQQLQDCLDQLEADPAPYPFAAPTNTPQPPAGGERA